MTYLDIAARGKNSWWRYLVAWPLAFLFWLIFVGVALIPPVMLHLVTLAALQVQSAGDHPVLFYGLQGLVFAGLIAGFALAAFLLHGKSFRDLCGNWKWDQAVTGGAIWLVVLIIGTAIDWGLSPKGFTFTFQTVTPVLVLTTVICLAIQTFAEEFIFRGYLTQSLFLAMKRPLVTAVISGLIFGAMHIPNGTPQAINAAVMGFVFALIAIRAGSLAFGWGMHFINNLFGAIIVVSANDVFKGTPAYLTQDTPELMWIDMVFGVIALAVLGLLIWKDERFIGPADRYPQ